MERIVKLEKLENLVARKSELNLHYNTIVEVPDHHVCICINKDTNEKQRLYAGKTEIKSMIKQIGLFQTKLKKQQVLFEYYLMSQSFELDSPWGGRFIYEDKDTEAEIPVGCNGNLNYQLNDYELLFDIMVNEGKDQITFDRIALIYQKYKQNINNAIIHHLSQWMAKHKSLSELNNKRIEAERYVLKQLLESNIDTGIIKITHITINEYLSSEAEATRKIKNSAKTMQYMNQKTKDEK